MSAILKSDDVGSVIEYMKTNVSIVHKSETD